MMLYFATEPPTTMSDIESYENDTGVVLPAEYIAFLLRSNGGRISPNILDLSDAQDDVLSRLYGVQSGQYDLAGNYRIMREHLPQELVPIGETSGGNILCIAVEGNNLGAVFHHYHDQDVEGEAPFPGFDNLTRISDSFDNFLSMLHR